MIEDLKKATLAYHEKPTPGKISINVTKPANTVDDLSLAYSPGVAFPVLEISKRPEDAYRYTAKGNLVAVISNGTAILGLGNLGALASKPVMEGKALLFKRFAGLDAIDIEINTENPKEFIETVQRIACTFGGINLEDIKAPECFEIERQLIECCDIPIMHDDQHGTAVVIAAGILNALELTDKTITNAKLVCLGAGAAAVSCSELLIELGLQPGNLTMLDSKGVIHSQRQNLSPQKNRFARDTSMRTLEDAIVDADIFLGLSGANLLSSENLKQMANNPIIFACANPDPEIRPELAKKIRPDVIIATGRSDFPNQVNNVLCFPFIFRGAMDVRARRINKEMKLAAIGAIRQLAKEPVPKNISDAYDAESLFFSPDYILPKPIDSRLLDRVPAAVAQAAIKTNTARLPYPSNYPPI